MRNRGGGGGPEDGRKAKAGSDERKFEASHGDSHRSVVDKLVGCAVQAKMCEVEWVAELQSGHWSVSDLPIR